ncbi:MAG TPA: hypothetical protein VFK02_35185 [Kofleriaceae bacterium]|nr:hypothetical protein [Kofleriaceae bacterium]
MRFAPFTRARPMRSSRAPSRGVRGHLAAVVALGLAGACTSRDIVASAGAEAPAYCRGPSPVILLAPPPGPREAVCTGSVAVRAFPRALCMCEDYAASTTLDTDSFDSAAGPYIPGGSSGDVGIDGQLRASAVVTAGGDLTVSGAGGAALLADVHVARDLVVGGPLGAGVTVTAGGDAHIAGDVDLAGLTVAGTLTVPDGASLAGTITAGSTLRAPVQIAPPCNCGAPDLVDVAGLVAAHATDNQDAAIGLTPDRLTGFHAPASLDLPCGVYYLGPVSGDAELTLRITGRVALLIDGDIALTAPLTIELSTDDAELDLLVAGIVSIDHALTIGRVDHPARTRVYLGGSGQIQLSGDSRLAANLYAPHAAVALSADATVHGSLFVRHLDQSAPLTIHYDVDVRRADIACPL